MPELIAHLSSADTNSLRAWLEHPNGSFVSGRTNVESVFGGGIMVRVRSFDNTAGPVEATLGDEPDASLLHALSEVLLKHEIDLSTITAQQLDASGIVVTSRCRCGELIDNDGDHNGWPAFARHRAEAILAALHTEPAVEAEWEYRVATTGWTGAVRRKWLEYSMWTNEASAKGTLDFQIESIGKETQDWQPHVTGAVLQRRRAAGPIVEVAPKVKTTEPEAGR